MIEVKNLSFSYDTEGKQVLKNVSLNVRKGEFLAVLGRNGSGKSTLAKHFNSVLLPMGGSVYVDGMDTSDDELIYEIRRRVGMVFQNPDNQLVATVVEEDVAFAPENLGIDPGEIRKRVDNALNKVGMGEYKMHAPHMLSGGQKQRVAIAGVIAMSPEYIVLDEPTAMLDPHGRREVMATLKMLNKDLGITVVLITHNMDEAVKADRVAVMHKGEVCRMGTPREIFSDVEGIKELGLDVPQATEIAHNLKNMGFDVRDDVLSPEEFAEEIGKVLRGR